MSTYISRQSAVCIHNAMQRKAKTLLFAVCISLLTGVGIVSASKPVIRSPREASTTGCYIVVLEDTTEPEEFERIVSQVKDLSIDRKLYAVVKNVQKAVTVKLSAHVLAEVFKLDRVKYIEEEDLVEGAALPWHLDRLGPAHVQIDHDASAFGNGEGVDIYILDTGIEFGHEEFEYRAKYAGYDPVDQYLQGTDNFKRMSGRDCHGHGTHVASLAGGKEYGVAKKASLYSVRVLRCDNSAPWSVILDGLDFVSSIVPERGRNAIVSISVSGHFHRSINDAIKALYQQGIPVVAAAGNNHGDACGKSPASSAYAITVGATNGENSLYALTNYGRCVDIFAPGESLLGALYTCRNCITNMTGSSQAVPLVSGVAAVYLSESPRLTPSQLRQRILHHSLEGIINFDVIPETHRSVTPNRLLSIGCRRTLYATDDRRVLQSPNFPMNYPNNFKCSWTVYSRAGEVSLDLSYFKLERDYDTLIICDDSYCSHSNTIAILTGKHEHTDCYVSTASALTVVMQTDGSSTSPGFNATYVNHHETSAENDKEKGCKQDKAISAIQLDVRSAGNRFSMKRDWEEIFAGRMQGLSVVILDELTGETSYSGHFDIYAAVQEADSFAAIIENSRSGSVFLVAASSNGAQPVNDRAKQAIRTLGSQNIHQLSNGDSWAMIGTKGTAPGTAIEKLDERDSVDLSIQYRLQQRRKHGLQIVAKSAGTSFGNFAEMSVEGETISIPHIGHGNGLHVVVINESNGNILHREIFDTHTDYATNVRPADAFASLINSLPNGRVVSIALKGEAIHALTEAAIQACRSIGSSLIQQIEYGGSWAIIGSKGAPIGSAAEAGSNNGDVQSTYWLLLDLAAILNPCNVSVNSPGKLNGLNGGISVNDVSLARHSRGISVAILEEERCVVQKVETFDTYASTQSADDIASLIHKVPIGRVVIATIWDEAGTNLTKTAILALESLGSAQIRNVRLQGAWGIIGRKGAARGSVPEVLHASSAALRATQQLKVKSSFFHVTAKSAGYLIGNYWEISVDGTVIEIPGAGYARGLNVIVINEHSGNVIHRKSFDTYFSSAHSETFANFISSLPNGRIVVIAIKDEATSSLGESALQACESIGSRLIRQIGFRHSWAIIGQKGALKGTIVEASSHTTDVEVDSWFVKRGYQIIAKSAGFLIGNYWEISVDGAVITTPGVTSRGMNMIVVNEKNGSVIHRENFDSHGSSARAEAFTNLLTSLPNGRIVAIAMRDAGTRHLTEPAFRACESIGSHLIRSIRHRESWAIIGRKGAPKGTVAEVASNTAAVEVDSWFVKGGYQIIAKSAGYLVGNYWEISVDGAVITTPGVTSRGMNVIVVNEKNGSVIHRENFDSHGSSVRAEAFTNLLTSLPNGRIVAIAMRDAGTRHLTEPAFRACESIGSHLIRSIRHRESWAIIGRKGAPKGTVAEVASNTAAVETSEWISTDYNACSIIVGNPNGPHRGGIDVNGQVVGNGQISHGVTVAVVDQSTCMIERFENFDTNVSSARSDQLAAMIQKTPPDKVVATIIWDAVADHLTENAKLALESIGSALIRNVQDHHAWGIIGLKGASPGSVPEAHHPNKVALQSRVKVSSETCDGTLYKLNCLTTSFTAKNSPILG